MPLDAITRTILEHYTAQPPRTEDAWYGPWTTILTSFFPPTHGYLVTPQQRLLNDDQSHIPDFIIEVVKISTPPLVFRTILIVKIKNTQHWPNGIQALKRQLGRQTDAAFAGTARDKVYWIGAIGPHWQYGERTDEGGVVQELSRWHDTIHDFASFKSSFSSLRLSVSLDMFTQAGTSLIIFRIAFEGMYCMIVSFPSPLENRSRSATT